MTTTDERYSGWTNRETWALMLHINNDQGLSEEYRALVAYLDQSDAGPYEAEDNVRVRVTELLNPDEYEATFGTAHPIGVARMAHEVGSLWRVNWTEVVDALRED